MCRKGGDDNILQKIAEIQQAGQAIFHILGLFKVKGDPWGSVTFGSPEDRQYFVWLNYVLATMTGVLITLML